MGGSGLSKEKKDIVYVGDGGDWILWRYKGGGSISLVTEGDS